MFLFLGFQLVKGHTVQSWASLSGGPGSATSWLARPFTSPQRQRRPYVTIEVSRRQLMASAGGMVLASFALPSSLRKIIAGAAPRGGPRAADQRGRLRTSEHVVVLMQENRSFDHYFGAMPGVRGFADPSVPKSRFYQYDARQPRQVPAALPHRHPQHQRAEPALQQPQLGSAARFVGQREDGRVRDRAPGRRRRRRASTRWPTSSGTTSRSTGPWPTPSPSATATTARCWARPGPTGCT